jgi:hypothetical protein
MRTSPRGPWLAVPLLLATMHAHAAPAAPGASGYKLVSRIAGPDGGWDYASVDPATHRLYVARTEGVMAVELDTGKVTPHLIDSQRGHAVLPIPGTSSVLGTNGTSNTAVLFDGHDGHVLATLPTGKKPDAATYDAVTQTAWVMNGDSGDATVLDVHKPRVVGTVPIGGKLEFAVVDGEGKLFVNVEDTGEIAVVDTRARKLLTRFKLPGCEEPSGLAYITEAKLLLSACANGLAKVVTREGREIASLSIGPHPDAALYDGQRKLAFIPSGGDGTLAVIRVTGPDKVEVIDRVPTKKGVRTAALDPTTGRLYLPSADFTPPAQAGARPTPVAGSFQVLVLSP